MRYFAILLMGSMLLGCGSSKEKSSKTNDTVASDSSSDTDPSGKAETAKTPGANVNSNVIVKSSDPNAADLAGRVTLNGEAPPARKLSITKDEEFCGTDESIQEVLVKDGGVANVVVEVKGIRDSKRAWPEAKDGYVIRQKKCQFVPNMIVMPVGKDLTVHNDDPVGHNVNTGEWNITQPSGGDPIVKPIESKSPVAIRCNIHSWMEGWIYPAQSPYYAVTDETGNFKIEGIPPGKYRVSIWHPYLGRTNERVTLKAGESAPLDHAFESK